MKEGGKGEKTAEQAAASMAAAVTSLQLYMSRLHKFTHFQISESQQ